MFGFKVPGTDAFRVAVERARVVNAAREELRAATRRDMLEFPDAAGFGGAIDERVAAMSAASPRD